jgi:hypothetical protein
MIVDRLLRQGAVAEVVGSLSSGRTSLLVACLREATRAGGAAALVDADDAFDPVSAARAGVDLGRVLWVRCGGRRDAALRAADLLVRCPGFVLVALDVGESPPRVSLAQSFRLKLAARRSGAALVVVARRRVFGAGAALAVETRRLELAWAGPRLTPTRLAGVHTDVRVLRRQGAAPSGGGTVWWSA